MYTAWQYNVEKGGISIGWIIWYFLLEPVDGSHALLKGGSLGYSLTTFIGIESGISGQDTRGMEAQKERALKEHWQKLRTRIIVANFLPACRKFLTDVEYSRIEGKTVNVEAVDELWKILLTKADREFDMFCGILEANGYEHWAKELRQSAKDEEGIVLESQPQAEAERRTEPQKADESHASTPKISGEKVCEGE